MKNVVLIGASGFVGTAILEELLNRGYCVTAVVRNPEKMTIRNANLSVVKADVSDVNTLAAVCKGKDAVISAYNPGWANPDIYEETLKNYPLILETVKNPVLNGCCVSAVPVLCFVLRVFGSWIRGDSG